ncbi:MAG TPA: carbohydrate kinase [Micromonosporaceae bacterium]
MFLVVGEAVVDLIARRGTWVFDACAGGSPLNVAVALARLGQPTRYAGVVGDDLFGELIRAHLSGNGIGLGHLSDGAAATSVAFARVAEDGSARYDFRFGWDLDTSALSLDGVACLHVGSLGCAVAPGRSAVLALVERAVDAGIPVSYDPNVRPALVGTRDEAVAWVERFVALADVVKASADDLAWLYPGQDEHTVLRRWLSLGRTRLAVSTRGAAGAVAVHAGGTTSAAAPPVTVVDTVGAGDTFTAALLARLVAEGALKPGADPGAVKLGADPGAVKLAADPGAVASRALTDACAAAALVCTVTGADPPTAAMVAEALDEGRGRASG